MSWIVIASYIYIFSSIWKHLDFVHPLPLVLVLVGSYWGTQSAPLGSSRVRADPGIEPGPGIR